MTHVPFLMNRAAQELVFAGQPLFQIRFQFEDDEGFRIKPQDTLDGGIRLRPDVENGPPFLRGILRENRYVMVSVAQRAFRLAARDNGWFNLRPTQKFEQVYGLPYILFFNLVDGSVEKAG